MFAASHTRPALSRRGRTWRSHPVLHPVRVVPHKLGRVSLFSLAFSGPQACFVVFMKNVWFHILYFYKENNGVRFTVYMDGRSQYVEQFYCFPLKNHFLGQAWGNTSSLLPWPLSTTHTASPSLNDRKGGQSVQSMFTEGSGI